MEIIAYSAAGLIGISLGLIGGGGSILTMPVLVYLFGINPLLATSYSLFIVGATSLAGAIANFNRGLVNIKTALLFGSASISTVFLTRKYLIPLIPKIIFSNKNFSITENMLMMVLFAILMLAAAIAMIKDTTTQMVICAEKHSLKVGKLLSYGIAIGLATGFLGAGGGFLLIPTLVILVGLPIKEAIGTSLFIIALNSLIGFTGDLGHFAFDWIFLFKITTIAIVGIVIGGVVNKKVNGAKLKKGFGWFVVFMGCYIIIKEIILK
ncbi:sulfite exporter TauE/SafE family protein [Pedobacter sandarakinus]|uniref:sulfite exporter TauE/SafE family protein n=1 Tax=Pedobacter sandarakinus TaxID=353156 RepID=UPI002246907D|nr:sulfite exporter TauE/SafE family protein [Pedobacter sandarakinus]MCX2575180.1 sulfite exporter TauE/SafE family protein [Pedobacter sandarakinus]